MAARPETEAEQRERAIQAMESLAKKYTEMTLRLAGVEAELARTKSQIQALDGGIRHLHEDLQSTGGMDLGQSANRSAEPVTVTGLVLDDVQAVLAKTQRTFRNLRRLFGP